MLPGATGKVTTIIEIERTKWEQPATYPGGPTRSSYPGWELRLLNDGLCIGWRTTPDPPQSKRAGDRVWFELPRIFGRVIGFDLRRPGSFASFNPIALASSQTDFAFALEELMAASEAFANVYSRLPESERKKLEVSWDD